MIVIHLARKPVQGTVAKNAFQWGTGGINIDECRIGTSQEDRDQMLQMSMGFVGRKWGQPEQFNYGYDGSMPIKTLSVPHNQGRWPSNMILEHLQGCVMQGAQEVTTRTHYPANRPPGSQTSGPSGHAGQTNLVEVRIPTELVDSWQCIEGCPVQDLNQQSGIHQGTGGTSSGASAFGQNLGWNPHNNRTTVITRHNDIGGASRFFKQVQDHAGLSDH